MPALLRDLRQALGALTRARRFAIITIATLALGFAASTLVFTLINAVLLRLLPYPTANSLAVFHWKDATGHLSQDVFASAFFALRERPGPFTAIAATYPVDAGVNLADSEMRKYVKAVRVSKEFFPTLETAPFMGRNFSAEEDRPGGARSTILSYELWQSAFRGVPEVIGHSVKINGETYTIIGIAPAGFWSYPKADLWIPLQLSPASAEIGRDYRLIARLRPGLTVSQGQQELNAMDINEHACPAPVCEGSLVLQNLQAFQTGNQRRGLMLLFGAVSVVLLIASINAAMLFLVRASARSSEIAVRLALGSSRARMLRFFLMESAVLTFLSGILGLILAKEMLPIVLNLAPSDLPTGAPINIDGSVVGFVALIFVLTTLVLGATAAFRFMGKKAIEKFKYDSMRYGGSIGQSRTLQFLVCLQTALTMVLLTGALSLLKNFRHLQAIQPGFDSQGAAVTQFSLAKPGYLTGAGNARLLQTVLETLQNLPGIEAVGSINGRPLEKGLNLPVYRVDAPREVEHAAEYRIVSGGYFAAMRIPLISGRPFSTSDQREGLPVAIVNQTLARRWWPHESPLGKFVNVSDELGKQFLDTPRQIVGVVADIRETSLDQPSQPTLFVPLSQASDGIAEFSNKAFLTSIVLRTNDMAGLMSQVRMALESADPDLPIASLRPLEEVLHKSVARPYFYTWLTTVLSALALLLSVVGIYGLLNYRVSLCSREIGIRMAFGATRQQVVTLAIQRALHAVTIGVVLGIAGILVLKTLSRGMIYNAENFGFGVVLNALAVFVLAALLASFYPAVRAASIEPMAVLRDE